MSMRLDSPSEKSRPLRIMIVEDSHFDRENLIRFLIQEGIVANFVHVVHKKQYIDQLDPSLDLIICDHKLPDFDSFTAFDLLEASGYDIPFIIVSGAISEDRAVQVLKRGAADFLSKNSLSRLTSSIREAIENKKLRIENLRAASALGQTRERLQIAMDSTELGTWDYSADEKKLSLCDRCIHVHSINKNIELKPIDFFRSIDKRDRKEFIERINALAKSGETRNFRMNYRVKDEEELQNSVWISLRGKIYFDQDFKFERLSGVLIDVSETKWLEEKLRSAVALAETSNHAKSSFLANMSHEIRTPLSAMIGFAEIMANDRVDPLDVVNFSNSIVSNGKKLLRIIDEVLDLSKVEKGKL
ncbi:MAG: hybrid sensor histidine kinase/response regulator, partial [Proteobacteria bacterium]